MYAGLTFTTRWHKYSMKKEERPTLTEYRSTTASINLFYSLTSAIFKSLT